MIRARYYEKRGTEIRCHLCPHQCLLLPDQNGFCGVRKNQNSEMVLPFAGILSAVAIDPIEKKPLYHFYPGKTIYSIGFFGCNFRCPFCQNYSISQFFPETTKNRTLPEKVVQDARGVSSFGIAYTYSEPLVHYEFVLETSILSHTAGLKNVLITNGYLNEDPLTELLPYLDAVNIDLKSYSENFYTKEICGDRNHVLDFIKRAAETIHVEVTTLIIPGKNDSPDEIREISLFLSKIDPKIPLHLSCYYPRYKYSVRETSENDLRPLLKTAREHLEYVYAGNVREETNTICPQCGNITIRRSGYEVSVTGLISDRCSRCGFRLPIINHDTDTGKKGKTP